MYKECVVCLEDEEVNTEVCIGKDWNEEDITHLITTRRVAASPPAESNFSEPILNGARRDVPFLPRSAQNKLERGAFQGKTEFRAVKAGLATTWEVVVAGVASCGSMLVNQC